MKKVSILVASDNKDSLIVIKKALELSKEFNVMGEVFNGNEVVKFVTKYQPDIILMDTNMPIKDGFAAATEISSLMPYIGIIFIGSIESIDVMRKAMKVGAGDFLEHPVSTEKLRDSILSLYIAKAAQRKNYTENYNKLPDVNTKIISVFSSKGGVGKSIVSANSAVTIKELTKRKVLLMDMDLQFGDAKGILNLKDTTNIVDMINAKQNIEKEDLEKYIISHKSGIKVLAAPSRPEHADMVNMDDVSEITSFFKEAFDYIIIDLPPLLNEITLGTIEMSDYVFLITTMEIPTIKNVKNALDILYQLGCCKEKIILVLNRFRDDSEIKLDEVKGFFNIENIICVEDDPYLVSSSINLGEPLVISHKNKNITKQIYKLCENVTGCSNYNLPEKKSFFKGFRKRGRK